MASVIHIECESCGGKSIVKIPKEYQDDHRVECCPLCGAAVDLDDDMGDDE